MSIQHTLSFPIQQFETATSYVSRLALWCGLGSPSDLCLDWGFRWQDFVRGDDALFDKVARLGGACPFYLKRWAVRTTAPHRFAVSGQEGLKSSLIRTRLRVCPQCLVLDHEKGGQFAMYRRHYWQFASMRTCGQHRRPIITLPHEQHTILNYDFLGLVSTHWRNITDAANADAGQSGTDLEIYIMRRLDGEAVNPFLDAMPLYIATRLCEVLGFVMLYGPKRKISGGTGTELTLAGQAGFDALKAGEEGLLAALESLVAPAALRTVHHQADLGALFEWLRSSNLGEAFEPLRVMVRDFIFRTYPIQDGHTVLGKACTAPSRYTIHSAWQSLGIQRKRMNRILIDEGLASLDADENTVRLEGALGVADIAQIAARMQDRLVLQEVCNLLAIGPDIVHQLRDRAILAPVTDALDQVPKYERTDVTKVLDRLSRRVTMTGTSHRRLVPILDAARRVRCPSADIIGFILDGRLQSLGHDVQGSGLSGFQICLGELRALLTLPDLPGRPKGETSRLLRVTYPTVNHLISEGLLTIERARNPRSRQFIDAVTFDSIVAFEKSYVTLGQLAQHYKRASGPLGCHLEAKGVCPIETPATISWIYERRGLMRRLDAIGLKAKTDRQQRSRHPKNMKDRHEEIRL
ncbi:MAG: TniQ family protein [Paracoccaceae bacterium]|uniref:TniQ family protein n=1 Tax=Yoonia sp. TaxID=2212373 RepID=UPI00328561A3